MSTAAQWLKANTHTLDFWDANADQIWGVVTSGGSGNKYTVSLTSDGRATCGCAYSWIGPGRFCSHLCALLLKMPQVVVAQRLEAMVRIQHDDEPFPLPSVTQMKGDFGYLTTTIPAFNDLMGGLPYGTMMGLYGPAGTGKSIIAIQAAFETLAQRPGDALFVDTEGGYGTIVEWTPILAKRYGLDVQVVPLASSVDEDEKVTVVPVVAVQKGKRHIFVADIRSIEPLSDFHGRSGRISISEVKEKGGELKGGKITWKKLNTGWVNDVWETPIGKWCAKHKICFLAYDSVTNPLEVFGSNAESFPARGDATKDLLNVAQLMTYEMSLVTVAIMHEVVNPQSTGGQRPQQTGGSGVAYNFKIKVYVEGPRKSFHTPQLEKEVNARRGKNTRLFWLSRHLSRKEWERPVLLDLTNDGYVGAGEKATPFVEPTDPTAEPEAEPEVS
jgi:hypothetical protein